MSKSGPNPGQKHQGKYVAYYRVSTKRQGDSGLGLEAQKEMLNKHLNGGTWDLIGSFTETESGKRTDRHRPQLKAALNLCKEQKATLIVAKLDRLTRNVSFLSRLLDSQIPFIACDIPEFHNPSTTKFMLQMLCNVAEYEANLISERTVAALNIKKQRGERLGSPSPNIGSKLGVAFLLNKANADSLKICKAIVDLKKYSNCNTLGEIKKALEVKGIKTPRGNNNWSLSSLRNVMIRGNIYNNQFERT